MNVSARTDYALRLLLELAADPGVPKTCEGIADAQGIPYRFLKSVVGDLRRSGLVVSQRGCEGGYWLARAASDITVAEVVEAVDGSVLTVRGEALAGLGYGGSSRHLDRLWGSLQASVDVLFATTVAQLAAGRLATTARSRRPARSTAAAT